MQLFRRILLYPLHLQLLVLMAACGSSQYKGNTTTEVPPLPPTANTSVGILLDERNALALLPEQVATLTLLESELEAVNEPLETSLANLEASSKARRPTKSPANGKSGATMRGGGGRRGGGGGGMRAGGKRGGTRKSPSTKARPHLGPSPEVLAKIQSTREMTRENNQIALARAIVLLSPAQREEARSLLDRNGHDIPEIALAAAKYQTATAHGGPMASPGRRGARCLAEQLQLSREHVKQLMLWLTARTNREMRVKPLDTLLSPAQQAVLDQTLNACGFEVSAEST